VIPARVALQQDGPDAEVHAVAKYSDLAFCGVWTTHQTGQSWPAAASSWGEDRPLCPLCAKLVYA
jgi:hypothetical protein